MSNEGRWRCLITGCNPLLNATSAQAHKEKTGHRVAAWPVRSAEGQRRAQVRNQTGYYRKYNVGDKSPSARGLSTREISPFRSESWDEGADFGSPDEHGQWAD